MTTHRPDAAALRDVAHRLADAARGPALAHFRQVDLAVDDKAPGAFDPVTQADRAAERAMRDLLAELRPQDAVLGEEYGETPGSSGLQWVLDPIDGTRAYLCGAPVWGVLIGLRDARGPIFGLIDQPHVGERFEGGFGHAAVTGPKPMPLRTRAPRALAEATVLTTFPEVGTPDQAAAFRAVADRARLVRYGLDCTGYALLAAGQVDLVIEAGLNAYDICAPIAVVEAAGGTVTAWDGGPAHDGGTALAAANPQIHADALAILSAHA
ncbi:MAG: inositol monophosphatase family protein [Paracoccaceae bacterium]